MLLLCNCGHNCHSYLYIFRLHYITFTLHSHSDVIHICTFRCLPLAIGCYRYILVVHPSRVIGKPTLLRLVIFLNMIIENEMMIVMRYYKKRYYQESALINSQERALVWLLILLPLAACGANLPFLRCVNQSTLLCDNFNQSTLLCDNL